MGSNEAGEKNTQLTEVANQVFEVLTGIIDEEASGELVLEPYLAILESIVMKHSTYKHVHTINKMIRPFTYYTVWNLDFATQVSLACKELQFNKASGSTCKFHPDHILQLGHELDILVLDPDVSGKIKTSRIELGYVRLLIVTFCQRAEAGWDMSWETLVKDAILVAHGIDGKYLLARELDKKDYTFQAGGYTVYGEEDRK